MAEIFAKTLKEGELPSGELAKIYLEYLASTLEGFLITEMAEPNSAASLVNSVIESFKIRALYEEGILLIGGLCQYNKANYISIMELIFPYIFEWLSTIFLKNLKGKISNMNYRQMLKKFTDISTMCFSPGNEHNIPKKIKYLE